MSNPLDKSAAKQWSSKIKFQYFFSTEIKFENYIMVGYGLVGTI